MVRSIMLLVGLLFLAQLVPAAAEEPLTIQAAKALVLQASLKVKSAQQVKDFDEVIAIATKALTGPLPDDQAKYARQLIGWGHNRRGEHLGDRAAAAADRGDDAEAMTFDDQSMAEFELALKFDPQLGKAWFNRGTARGLRGDVPGAVEDLTKAVELDPKHANSRFNRAELLSQTGKLDEAFKDYNEAIRLAPKDIGAYLGRGRVYSRQGKFAESLADFQTAAKIDSRSPAVYIMRGDALADLGRWGEALDDYRTALRLDPKRSRAHAGVAWILATAPDDKLRDPAAALAAGQKAIALDGEGDWRSLDALAAAFAASGRFDDARAACHKSLILAPTDLAERIKVRLALYEKGQAFRESPRK